MSKDPKHRTATAAEAMKGAVTTLADAALGFLITKPLAKSLSSPTSNTGLVIASTVNLFNNLIGVSHLLIEANEHLQAEVAQLRKEIGEIRAEVAVLD